MFLVSPVVPFYRSFFGWEGSPTKIDYRKKKVKKGTRILTSLLEDLVEVPGILPFADLFCSFLSLFFLLSF